MGQCPITGGEQLQPQTIGKIARKHTGGGKIAYLFQSFMQQPPINAKGRANFVIAFAQIAVFVQPTGQFHRQCGNIAIADFLGNLAQNVVSIRFSAARFQHGGDIAFPSAKSTRTASILSERPARSCRRRSPRGTSPLPLSRKCGIKG